MSGQDSIDVTLAHVDPSLLSCWQEMVKRGEECTLMLKHSRGQVTATLQSTNQASTLPEPSLPSSASAKKKKKKKGNKKKRLEALLAYHQRLVEEKGLPPSRLMLQQAAAATTSPSASATLSQSPGTSKMLFKCDLCDFSSKSKRGLKVHTGRSHKEKDQQMQVAPTQSPAMIQNTAPNIFPCDQCAVSFSTENSLITHMAFDCIWSLTTGASYFSKWHVFIMCKQCGYWKSLQLLENPMGLLSWINDWLIEGWLGATLGG